ncbi:hypothetical protein AB0B10_25975 [Micromonospora arborensis]|uniref:hypothetical protein n=1 Tax=Micromonospora arborensis TaxID=2116518 RepID=UPI0034029A9F
MDETTTGQTPFPAANWKPLEATLPADQLGDWMYMGRVERGARVIHQYKHRETRRYLNLDEQGQAWQIRYTPDCDVPDVDPIPLADAIARALS